MNQHSFFIIKFMIAINGIVSGAILLAIYPLLYWYHPVLILAGILISIYLMICDW